MSLAEALQSRRFVVTSELSPPKGTDLQPMLDKAALLRDWVDAINVTDSAGAHMTLAPLVVEKVRERGVDIPVIVGGIGPDVDVEPLKAQGVAKVLTPGATAEEVAGAVRSAIDEH